MVDERTQQYQKVLEQIPDPEIPTISIVELGIVRGLAATGSEVVVTITPTYSGCPAMGLIETQIRESLAAAGATKVTVTMTYSPPWTTEWLTPEARAKLKAAGIAPPASLVTIGKKPAPVPCPFCNATQTELRSQFGSTACKALYFCKACVQPFELFKAI